ncbi:MAG: cupin domain-containing protein [Elusimicrobia bacterium]|nr:cupin domain-containing protein [Elusimicrobiota bacterium]
MKRSRKQVRFGRLGGSAQRAYGPLGVEFLLDEPRLAPISVLRVFLKPGDSHPPIFHARTTEFFLVLRGENAARINGRLRRMKAGEFAFLPPGTVHEFRAGARGVEVLVIFGPAMDFRAPDIAHATPRRR